MTKKCKVRILHKLSNAVGDASLTKTAEHLHALRRLVSDAAGVAANMAAVIQGLKQVAAPQGEPFIFTTELAENEALLRHVFANCDDIKYRPFLAGGKKALLVYLQGLADFTLLENSVLEMLMSPDSQQSITIDNIINSLVIAASVEKVRTANDVIKEVMGGHALLLIDGEAEMVLIGAIKSVQRSVEEPKTETVVRGPHDAFTEALSDNVALIRRRARDPDIKVRIFQIGERNKTAMALVYAESLVKPGLVAEVERRISDIKIDYVILSTTIEEFIIDRPWSPFPQTYATERPDTFLATIYEGRAGIILDNTPHALLVPCTFATLLQSPDDFMSQPVIATLLRLTRYITAGIGIFLPAVYIAITSYHPGMLPTTLAISVAEIRSKTPYPAFLEVIIMESILEIFQEAVIRLPQKISPAASIVGGFVIGTTIVQAGLVNAMLVVAMAGTSIAAFTMPSYSLGLALRWLRIPTIIAASVLGFYGLILAYMAIVVHMCSLRSFGESYLGGLFDVTLIADMKDKLVRLPATLQKTRSKQFGAQDRTRLGE